MNPNRILIWAAVATVLMLSPHAYAAASCGNQSCEIGENSCTCASDCGSCESFSNEFFDYSCIENVCRQTPKTGVCGNELCEENFDEDYGNCAVDCEPTELEFELVSPTSEQTFARGQTGTILLKITSSGKPIPAARVTAVRPFRNVTLANNGFNNEYTARFVIPPDAEEKTHSMQIRALFRSIDTTAPFPFTVKAELVPDLNFETEILLGNTLEIRGKIRNGEIPVQMSFDASIQDPLSNEVFAETIQTDANGEFQFQFKTSLIDPPGNWIVLAHGTDANNNTMEFQKTISLIHPSQQRPLSITRRIEGPTTVPRGSRVTIIAQVLDSNRPISDANLVLIPASGEPILFPAPLDENYSLLYTIPGSLPLGENTFVLRATRKGILATTGQTEFDLNIVSGAFSVTLLKPTQRLFNIGDRIEFQVSAQYESSQPVLEAKILLRTEDVEFELSPLGGGYYTKHYVAQESDTGPFSFKVVATDSFGNSAEAENQIEIFGYGPAYYASIYGIPAIAILFLLIGVGFGIQRFQKQRLTHEQARNRKNQLLELEKQIQRQYFEQGALNKTEFENRMLEYEDELKKLNQILQENEGEQK